VPPRPQTFFPSPTAHGVGGFTPHSRARPPAPNADQIVGRAAGRLSWRRPPAAVAPPPTPQPHTPPMRTCRPDRPRDPSPASPSSPRLYHRDPATLHPNRRNEPTTKHWRCLLRLEPELHRRRPQNALGEILIPCAFRFITSRRIPCTVGRSDIFR
jgi:hypothetical protein